jgi:hypothetical protein
MKAAFYGISLALCMLGANPAAANDFASVCVASPPSGLPANAIPGQQFCGCLDKETAGNDKLRAEFLESFKIKEMYKRGASLSPEGRTIVTKCGAH